MNEQLIKKNFELEFPGSIESNPIWYGMYKAGWIAREKLTLTKLNLLSDELKNDLFITALEGGSNYWYMFNAPMFSELKQQLKNSYCELTDGESVQSIGITHEQLEWLVSSKSNSELLYFAIMTFGYEYDVFDIYTDEKIGRITKQQIEEADSKMMLNESYKQYIFEALNDNWDANTADVWFQFVVLNEVVYG